MGEGGQVTVHFSKLFNLENEFKKTILEIGIRSTQTVLDSP